MKAPRKKTTIFRYWGFLLRRSFRRVFASLSTPHKIALGGAIGVFVAFTPTVGIQSVISVSLALLVKANPIAAYFPVWITNPATIPVIYYFNTRIGAGLLGRASELNWEYFRSINIDNFFDKLLNMLWPLTVGSVLVGLVAGALSYPLFYYAAAAFRKRREKQVLKWRNIIGGASLSERFPESARRRAAGSGRGSGV